MFGRKKKIQDYIKSNFGKNPLEGRLYYNASSRMEEIRIYHDNLMEQSTESENKNTIDEITWNDLEMDQLFLRVNHANSFVGEQMLYHQLHKTSRNADSSDRSIYAEQLNFLGQNETARLRLETLLFRIGKSESDYYLSTFLLNSNQWRISFNWVFRLLQIFLVLFALSSVILNSILCLAGLILVSLVNLVVYLYMKQKYEIFLGTLGCFRHIYQAADGILKDREVADYFGTEEVGDAVSALKKLSRLLIRFSGRKQASMTGDIFALFADYLWGITLLDISAFNKIMKMIEVRQQEVMTVFHFLGDIDAAIAVVSYRKSIPVWCGPDLLQEGIRTVGLIHPLLKEPVSNDFILNDRVIVTGANASGKSTFMKALALNVILAQTILTCTAKEFSTALMAVMTSMALRDDVISGESYYLREVRYLKRMIDRSKDGVAILCVIDEILKGTNTQERLAASKSILEYLSQLNCLALIATHDLELTRNEKYKKYYFDSFVTENDVRFEYIIHEGTGGKSNAIALLELLEFPPEIVKKAKEYINLEQME